MRIKKVGNIYRRVDFFETRFCFWLMIAMGAGVIYLGYLIMGELING